ncbi:endonuclease III [Eubacteriales bacterium OttesenSCG-928-A19]|nr:endonuclease III [Eubacteriales bacterium OttesenSCG-928-A19]
MTPTEHILKELSRLYPDVRAQLDFRTPYELLVATMLAAQSTDKQVNKVTPTLFATFPDVFAIARLTADELYPYVKSCGFKSKAGNIVRTSQILVEKYGGEVPRTREALVELPGVGRKTANVVLANAFGIPTMAVDTHVFRVSNRLGLAHAKDVLRTERQLLEVIPEEDLIDAHHWLIYHGRQVCHARKPACETCTLREWCEYYNSPKEENA